MTDTHPLFADRPELDQLAFAMVHRLHSQIPEEKRPTSWSDFTEAQVLRAKEAAQMVYDAGQAAFRDKMTNKETVDWHIVVEAVADAIVNAEGFSPTEKGLAHTFEQHGLLVAHAEDVKA